MNIEEIIPTITKNRENRFGSAKTTTIWNKTHGKCGYCGIKLRENGPNKEDPDIFTLDHIIPLSKGGTKDIKNLLGACKKCNNLKGGSDNLDFLRMRILISQDKMPKFNEKQFNYLYNKGINLGRLIKYEFYFEKLGIK